MAGRLPRFWDPEVVLSVYRSASSPQDKIPPLSPPPLPSWRLVNSHQNKSFRVIGFHSTFILLKRTVWGSLIAGGSY